MKVKGIKLKVGQEWRTLDYSKHDSARVEIKEVFKSTNILICTSYSEVPLLVKPEDLAYLLK